MAKLGWQSPFPPLRRHGALDVFGDQNAHTYCGVRCRVPNNSLVRGGVANMEERKITALLADDSLER